ncbi:MAG: hypothetical protein GF381_00325 [Candidatus Pacebacteria bacterium]|nr:hypothetical protein [Candidatus Paceibacterota bacterium]
MCLKYQGLDKTRSGADLSLSRIYSTLKNPFYYGEFEYGDEWYKGTHEPLVSKTTWDKVQKQLKVPPKNWNKRKFPFKVLCTCASCGASITAEEKYKKLKNGDTAKYVYYHCSRMVDYDCDEPYLTEDDLIKQLIAFLNADKIKINKRKIAKKLEQEIERFHKLRSQVLKQEYLSGNLDDIENSAVDSTDKNMAKNYLKHVLKTGSAEDRRQALSMVETRFVLNNKELRID